MRSFFAKKSLTFQIFFSSPRLIGLLHLLKFFWLLSMWDICRWLTNSKGQFWPITQTQSFFLHLSFPYKEELVMFLPKDQWTSLGHEPDTLQSLFKTSNFLKLRKNFGNFLLPIVRHGNGHFPIFFPNFYENIWKNCWNLQQFYRTILAVKKYIFKLFVWFN
jgi:hypothetical protein